MSTGDPSLWNFVNWDSIWPLPHVILAYNAYMYTRNWTSVLCTYYLVKVMQLLLFSLFGLQHRHFFAEILQVHGSNSCVVDFNGLFIGGTVQTGLGILLGMAHCHVACPSLKNPRNFVPVHFWKAPGFLEEGDVYEKLSLRHPKEKLATEKMAGTRNFFINNGLWPPAALFGWRGATQFFSPPGGWGFRKIFWKRWIQLAILGAPALFFYTLEPKSSMLRAGSVFYGFVTCALLLVYKYLNQEIYLEWLLSENDMTRGSGRESFPPTRSDMLFAVTRSSYDSTYALWISTVTFLIGFQSVPNLTAFYKVLLASAISAAFVIVTYYASKFAEERLLQERLRGKPVRGDDSGLVFSDLRLDFSEFSI